MSRRQIVREYMDLRRLLNQPNKRANLRSELQFSIEKDSTEYHLFAVNRSDTEAYRICLALRTRRCPWERSGLTEFASLETYCAEFINDLERIMFTGREILGVTDDDLVLIQHELSFSLKGLLQHFNYKP